LPTTRPWPPARRTFFFFEHGGPPLEIVFLFFDGRDPFASESRPSFPLTPIFFFPTARSSRREFLPTMRFRAAEGSSPPVLFRVSTARSRSATFHADGTFPAVDPPPLFCEKAVPLEKKLLP